VASAIPPNYSTTHVWPSLYRHSTTFTSSCLFSVLPERAWHHGHIHWSTGVNRRKIKDRSHFPPEQGLLVTDQPWGGLAQRLHSEHFTYPPYIFTIRRSSGPDGTLFPFVYCLRADGEKPRQAARCTTGEAPSCVALASRAFLLGQENWTEDFLGTSWTERQNSTVHTLGENIRFGEDIKRAFFYCFHLVAAATLGKSDSNIGMGQRCDGGINTFEGSPL
jgi:hypothetical protein